jgi:sigma-B regulation protein RsbU (phosphoserine phosphatase)
LPQPLYETAPNPLPLAGMRHVLIVDDSRAQRRLLSIALKRGGYRVSEAASAEEALMMCANTCFDLVISDWMMPGISGLDFCRAFRALPRQSYGYFILLTSRSDSNDVASGLDSRG